MADSSQPSPAEINFYGTVVAKAHYVNATLTFMDVGIQLFMCLYGLSIFLETPKQYRKGRVPFIVLSFLIWVFSALVAALDSWTNFRMLFDAGPTGREYIIQWRSDFAGSLWYSIVSATALVLYITIGDCLMLYRCFAIWRDRKWVMVLPTLTFLASFALGIATIYPWPRYTSRLPTSAWTLVSVAMNLMVTFLIVLRLVSARRRLAKALPDRETSHLYSSVIAIVIESATPVTVFGICFAIMLLVMTYSTTTLHQASVIYVCETMFAMLYYSFCALSPQMIIFRVTTGRSWMTSYDREKAAFALSRPLQFAHGAVSSTDARTFTFRTSVSDGTEREEQNNGHGKDKDLV